MTILAYPIPNLINGVSQQAPQQRRDTQAESQKNCVNSPVDGCYARPGSKHVALLEGEDFSNAFIQDVIRSDDEKYRIVIDNGMIRAFDLITGEEGTITPTTVDAEDYLLTAGNAKDAFRLLTIEDTTFIANRDVTPAMIPYTPPADSEKYFDSFIYIRAGNYNREYAFYLRYGANSWRYTVTTLYQNRGSAENLQESERSIEINNMASAMYTALTSGQGANPALTSYGFSVTLMGNIIRVRRSQAGGGDYKVDGWDDNNMQDMIVIKESVKRFGDLPNRCWAGSVLRVAGTDGGTTADDYWVKWTGDDGTQGVWDECAAPAAATRINEKTMPHTLFALGGNEYTFGPETWETRIAGDGINSAKNPSFIGRKIQDLTFTRDRFGIMTEASISLSKSKQYFTHFPDTVQTQLDTAPIDVRLASTHIAILRDAVAHGQNLFFWADGIQFVLASGDTLTQKTVEIEPSTDFDYSARVKPTGIGDNLVFTNESGKFSQVYEQFAAQQGVNKEADDITAHVPKYIPAKLRWFTGSTTLKSYVVSSEDRPNILFVYNYFVVGDQKQQSAWDRWEYPESHDIIYGNLDSNDLHLCIQRPDGVAFETLDASPDQVDEGGTYLTRLDRRVDEGACAWVYDEATDKTTLTLPYEIEATELSGFVAVSRAGGPHVEGHIYEPVSVSGAEVVVVGEITEDEKFYAGFIPVAEYEFSPFYPKDDKGAFIYERTQVRYANIAYSKTGWTRAVVTRIDGRVNNNVFEGRTLGSPTNILGGIAIADGVMRVPIKSAHDRYSLMLINDSPFPSAWQSATMDFTPTVRAQRLG